MCMVLEDCSFKVRCTNLDKKKGYLFQIIEVQRLHIRLEKRSFTKARQMVLNEFILTQSQPQLCETRIDAS